MLYQDTTGRKGKKYYWLVTRYDQKIQKLTNDIFRNLVKVHTGLLTQTHITCLKMDHIYAEENDSR